METYIIIKNHIKYWITFMQYFLIKLLGGYTPKEHTRVKQKYKALLDSKTDDKSVQIANEYIYMLLKDLQQYARTVLYGEPLNEWASKMYNVIHNNMIRIVARYLYNSSAVIYKIDTTLDQKGQFMNVLKEGNEEDEIDYIISQMAGTD